MKKYLKTIEEVLALKDTDTKIYIEGSKGHYKFVQGTLCYFEGDSPIIMFSSFGIGRGFSDRYILVEKEANENDIGKLCWFWDKDEKYKKVGILDHIENNLYYTINWYYAHCRRVTPAELVEFTGYKVEEEL